MQSAPEKPQAVDPYATAAAQTQGDVQSAIANSIMGNADVRTPFGSSTSQQIGTYQIKDAQGNTIDVPKWMQTQTLSPEGQGQLDQQNRLASGTNNLAIGQIDRLGSVLGTPFTGSNLPAAQNSLNLQTSIGSAGPIQRSIGADDFSKDRDAVTQALMSRIQPDLDRSQAALDAKLANQGINAGSTAYTDANVAQGRTANDARMQALLAGSQEQSRLFGLQQAQGQFANAAQAQAFGQNADQAAFGNNAAQMGATFANTARERALQEQLAIRNQPINEVTALTSGNQVTVPQFSQFNGGQIAGSTIGQNIMGSAQMAQQQWQTQAQMAAANNAGIYGLGAAAIGAGARMYTGK